MLEVLEWIWGGSWRDLGVPKLILWVSDMICVVPGEFGSP